MSADLRMALFLEASSNSYHLVDNGLHENEDLRAIVDVALHILSDQQCEIVRTRLHDAGGWNLFWDTSQEPSVSARNRLLGLIQRLGMHAESQAAFDCAVEQGGLSAVCRFAWDLMSAEQRNRMCENESLLSNAADAMSDFQVRIQALTAHQIVNEVLQQRTSSPRPL